MQCSPIQRALGGSALRVIARTPTCEDILEFSQLTNSQAGSSQELSPFRNERTVLPLSFVHTVLSAWIMYKQHPQPRYQFCRHASVLTMCMREDPSLRIYLSHLHRVELFLYTQGNCPSRLDRLLEGMGGWMD